MKLIYTNYLQLYKISPVYSPAELEVLLFSLKIWNNLANYGI